MIFDAVVIVVVLVSALIAFLRGLIREILTILGVAGGAGAAYFIGPMVSPMARGWVTPQVADGEDMPKFMDIVPYPVLGDVIAYGAVFVLFVIILSVISHFLSGWVKSIGLGMADRLLGALFGFVRGLLVVTVFFLPFYLLIDKKERDKWSWVQESKTMPYVEKSAAFVDRYLPHDVKDDMKDTKNKVEKTARETLQEIEANKSRELERKNAQGYENDDRQGMDALIKDKLNDAIDGAANGSGDDGNSTGSAGNE